MDVIKYIIELVIVPILIGAVSAYVVSVLTSKRMKSFAKYQLELEDNKQRRDALRDFYRIPHMIWVNTVTGWPSNGEDDIPSNDYIEWLREKIDYTLKFFLGSDPEVVSALNRLRSILGASETEYIKHGIKPIGETINEIMELLNKKILDLEKSIYPE